MAEKEQNKGNCDAPKEDEKQYPTLKDLYKGWKVGLSEKHPVIYGVCHKAKPVVKTTVKVAVGVGIFALGYNKGEEAMSKKLGCKDDNGLDIDTNNYIDSYSQDYSESYIPQNEAASESFDTAESSSETIVNE